MNAFVSTILASTIRASEVSLAQLTRSCHRITVESSRARKLILIWLFGVAPFLLRAQYEATMQVFLSVTNDQDSDLSRPGVQSAFVYNVVNNSYDLQINNMISFTVPAGTDAGIYKASPEVGWYDWISSLSPNSTVTTSNSQAMPPGQGGTLKLYSDFPFTRQAYVTAASQNHGDFVPVLTLVPAPPPPSPRLMPLSAPSNTATLFATNLASGYSYTLQSSDALLNWTNAQSFRATSTSQTLSTESSAFAPAQFFRLASP